jgi:L-ascorbate metabolism protein UlaG (beta-lactamase superfamily)
MAGLVVNARGTILMIDPLITLDEKDGEQLCEGHYKLLRPLPLVSENVPRLDVVCYTHADADHFGRLTAIRLIEQTRCRFAATPPVADRLSEMGLGPDRLVEAEANKKIRIGAATIEVTPAKHDWQETDPWRRGDCCGYVIRTPDGAIWHPGDTELIDELRAISAIDILMFDIAAVDSHLGPEGSAELAKTSGAKTLIAYHYGTFDLPPGSYGNCDPEDAKPYVEELVAEFKQPNPGQVLRLPH